VARIVADQEFRSIAKDVTNGVRVSLHDDSLALREKEERKGLEARVGIEPTHKGFADLSLTTWVPRPKTKVASED
jgi:hypothetical protein